MLGSNSVARRKHSANGSDQLVPSTCKFSNWELVSTTPVKTNARLIRSRSSASLVQEETLAKVWPKGTCTTCWTNKPYEVWTTLRANPSGSLLSGIDRLAKNSVVRRAASKCLLSGDKSERSTPWIESCTSATHRGKPETKPGVRCQRECVRSKLHSFVASAYEK